MAEPDEHYDVVVIGAGAGGMTAACVAACEGGRVLLVEKAGQVGGTTALSGGMVWIPANRKMAEAGLSDTPEAARAYLAATVPEAEGDPLLESFIDRGDEAIAYLETHTSVKLRPVLRYPDYYPDRVGATPGGRVLEPVPFHGAELGCDFRHLAPPLPEFTIFGGMMIGREEIPHLRRAGRSAGSTWRILKLLGRHARERLTASRGTTLHLGNALAGRLLLSCRQHGVMIALGSTAELAADQTGRPWRMLLRGAEGRTRRIVAEGALVLATGGYSRDAELRGRTFPGQAGPSTATSAGSTGAGIRLGLSVGGRLGERNVSPAYWVPGSRFRRPDGTEAVFPHTVTDRAKPGIIALDMAGRRFVNEAVSYHEFVLAMLRATNGEARCALICDRRALWRYGLGRVKPFALSLRAEIESGYLTRAGTIRSLAGQLGIQPDEAERALAAYNQAAREGLDPEFGRGRDIYQRHLGDADRTPNPCVAPVAEPPFYAVILHPADLGTATGLETDPEGAVLGADGRPIPGLFACGNDMNSVMKGTYPGPGITLGPALTFGYLAGRRAAAPHAP